MKSRFCFLLLITILLTSCKQSSVPTNTIEPSRAPTQAATSTLDALVATRVAATLTAQAAPPTPTSLATTTVTPQPTATATATATAHFDRNGNACCNPDAFPHALSHAGQISCYR